MISFKPLRYQERKAGIVLLILHDKPLLSRSYNKARTRALTNMRTRLVHCPYTRSLFLIKISSTTLFCPSDRNDISDVRAFKASSFQLLQGSL